MTPAEREALPPMDDEFINLTRDLDFDVPGDEGVYFRLLVSRRERQLLAKMSLISTLELTLSNATRRIAALESSAKDFIAAVERVEPHVNAMIGLQYARNRTQYEGPNYIEQKASLHALLAPPPEPIPEEK